MRQHQLDISRLESRFPSFFWQPNQDIFKNLCSCSFGRRLVVSTNYLIWIFLFVVSFLLINQDINYFWQIFAATIISEVVEKYLKIKNLWVRPVCRRHNQIPKGLIATWYKNGSFPSGHAMKAAFFFLFLINSPIAFSPIIYLIVTLPLVLVRIPLGLHYPIDFIGGSLFGVLIWFLVGRLNFPPLLLGITSNLYYSVFFFLKP